jgi:hypothetical protein
MAKGLDEVNRMVNLWPVGLGEKGVNMIRHSIRAWRVIANQSYQSHLQFYSKKFTTFKPLELDLLYNGPLPSGF